MRITPDTFAELTDLEDGDFQREIDATMAEVIEAVTLHGLPGAVTITLPVLPSWRDGQMGVTFGGKGTKVTGKKPTRAIGTSFRYITKNGALVKINPGQQVLPFTTVPNDSETRIVSAESTDVRSVN